LRRSYRKESTDAEGSLSRNCFPLMARIVVRSVAFVLSS
jgi:hypothetical protein